MTRTKAHFMTHHKKPEKRQSGFTLLEMTISLLVVGFLIAPLLLLYSNHVQQKRIQTTKENVQAVINALQNQRQMLGYYPCPSPINAERTAAEYGQSSGEACDGAADPAAATLGTGSCGGGFCVEESIRTDVQNRRVVVGGIPFRTLQLDEKQTIDAYGNRMVYAITETMTDSNTIVQSDGAIQVVTPAGAPLIEPEGSVSFIVIAPGRSQVGAYSQDGRLITACAGDDPEIENCNAGFETGTAAGQAIYVSGLKSDAETTDDLFDDYVGYFTSRTDAVWRRIDANLENIEELSPKYIGMGTNQPEVALEIEDAAGLNGNGLFVANGSILLTDELCDTTYDIQDGATTRKPCFELEKIVGNTGIRCPSGQYLQGISNGQAVCTSTNVTGCPDPANQAVTGIDSNGDWICSNIPEISCASMSVDYCGQSHTLSGAIDGGFSTISAGSCLVATWKCEGGVWDELSVTGACNGGGDPVDDPSGSCQTYDCDDISPGLDGEFCGFATNTCTGLQYSAAGNQAAQCTCPVTSSTETIACSQIPGFENYIGNATRTRTTTPDPSDPLNCPVVLSPWNTDSCTCNPALADRTSSQNCPTGQSGGPVVTTWAFDAAACDWLEPVVTGECVCNAGAPAPAGWQASRPPVCDGSHPDVTQSPLCYRPTANATFSGSWGPNGDETCAWNETQTSPGTCSIRPDLTWQPIPGSPPTNIPPSDVNVDRGDLCSCPDVTAGNTRLCVSGGQVVRCRCEPSN